MRKHQKTFAALLCVLAFIAALSPWPLSDTRVAAALADAAAALGGARVSAGAGAAFALLPRPRILLRDVRLADAAAAIAAAAPGASLELRILPLLAGRIEVARIALDHPDVAVDLDALPPLSRSGPRSSRWPGAVAFAGGHAKIAGIRAGFEAVLDNLDFELDQASGTGPLAATARGLWRGEPFKASVWSASPAGARSDVALAFDSAPLAADVSGDLSIAPAAAFRGHVRIASANAALFARLCGPVCRDLPDFIETIDVQGDLNAGDDLFSVENLLARLNGNALEGVVSWRAGRRGRLLSGTLASDQLRVSAGMLVRIQKSIAGRQRRPVDRRLAQASLDLRLSVTRTDIGALHFEDSALAVMRRDGVLRLELDEAKAYGGSLKAALRIENDIRPPRAMVTAAAKGIDLAAFCADAACPRHVAGLANIDLSASAAAGSLAAGVEHLDGAVTLDAGAGSFQGPDFEQILRRLEKRSFALATDQRQGRTAFNRASATVKIHDGIALIEGGLVAGLATRLQFGGTANLALQTLSVSGTAAQTGPGGKARDDGPHLDFTVTGPWDGLAFKADAAKLLRQLGETTPRP